MPDRATLVAAAHRSIRRGSASFAAASALFDRQTRERVWLLYAWCRRCDDIADGQDHGGTLSSDGDAPARIAELRRLTMLALAGEPTGEMAFDAFGQVARECGLTAQDAEDVIQGFVLDADDWRPRSEADMMRYCYHVAGAVGVMMARVMGVAADDAATLDRACDLGLAFQLNNIARDLWEDDAAGRCYLPEEWLVEADIPPGQHMKVPYRQALVAMVARMVAMAEQHEAAARVGAAKLAFRQRWAILSAANIYGAIGREVRARGDHGWDHRVHTGKAAKLGFVAQALVQALRSAHTPGSWPRWTRAELAELGRK